MATSSITKIFLITDDEEIEAFADAVELSANDKKPVRPISARQIKDTAELSELMRKWKKANV